MCGRSLFHRLLVLALVPVLIIAGPLAPGANAVETFGPYDHMSVSGCGEDMQSACVPFGNNKRTCSWDAGWKYDSTTDSQSVVVKNFHCRLAAILSNNASPYMTVSGINSSGVFCGGSVSSWNGPNLITGQPASNPVPTPVDVTKYFEASFSISAPSVLGSTDEQSCRITKFCLTLQGGEVGSPMTCTESTTFGGPTLSDVEAPVPTGCAYGEVTKPIPEAYAEQDNEGPYAIWRRSVSFSVKSTFTSPQYWTPYVLVADSRQTAYQTNQSETSLTYRVITDPAMTLVTPLHYQARPPASQTPYQVAAGLVTNFSFNAVLSTRTTNAQNIPMPTGRIVGFGVYRSSNGNTPDSQPSDQLMGKTPLEAPAQVPYNFAQGRIGVTSAPDCAWYWGERITNANGSDPIGPIEVAPSTDSTAPSETPAPTPDDPNDKTCDFDIASPSTWLSGGTCAIVGMLAGIFDVLGKILSAFGGLASAIAGPIVAAVQLLGGLIRDVVSAVAGIVPGIISGLKDLLIPSVSSWDLGGLVDQVKDRPPFSLMVDLIDVGTNFADGYTGTGGCNNLIDFGGDMKVSCSTVKNVPGYALGYGFLTVAMWACTGLACFRMFTSNFGDQS